jgi:hypothetical protein
VTPRIFWTSLFYGPHADYAARLLGSLDPTGMPFFVSFLLHDVCDETRKLAYDWGRNGATVWSATGPATKANALRWAIARAAQAGCTHLIWTDDDTWFPDLPVFVEAVKGFVDADYDLGGKEYRIPLRGLQHKALEKQFPDDAFKPREVARFPTGGCWFAKISRLQEIGFPFFGMGHKGEDYILGLLAHRLRWRIAYFERGFTVNAAIGKSHSTAKTRGANPRHWGEDGETRAHDCIHEVLYARV